MKILNILNSFSPKSVLLASLVMGLSLSAHAVTMYKWVDADGNISYQDRPPPSGNTYEQKSFSDEGARTGGTNTDVARSRAVSDNPVVLYVAENCESCNLVGAILDANKVPYQSIKVDTDAAAQRKLKELAGSLRVPTLTIGKKTLNGVDRAGIERALREAGYPEAQTGAQ